MLNRESNDFNESFSVINFLSLVLYHGRVFPGQFFLENLPCVSKISPLHSHAVYNDLADANDLLKLGGSDYHGRGGQHESDVGSTSIPVVLVHEFLKLARPIWSDAIQDNLRNYIKDPSELNSQRIMKFCKTSAMKTSCTSSIDIINQCLSAWLSKEEIKSEEFDSIKSELSSMLDGYEECK